MTSCSVLIADDDPSVRSLLKVLLDSEQGIKVAGTARNGDEAVKESHRLRPDVVLMDVQMPVTDGPEAARALCSDADGPRVIMLTMFDLDSYVYEALRAGASGFLLKNSPPAAVVAAVRTAQEGTPMLSPQITRRLVAQLAPVRPAGPSSP
ncbi:response regulator [Actinomyces wuliandei]|uniref:response regulator n=1 Tax=Actinomyces wuliandei TaxID=2057743 RepID=UPI001FAA0ADA|nr:response regulator transcription factor [Actinomyces wuliandei]